MKWADTPWELKALEALGHVGLVVLDWFVNVALDGIGGGVVGGAVAYLLLRRTIEHERNLRSAEKQDSRTSELRNAIGKMQGLLAQIGFVERKSGNLPLFGDVMAILLEVEALAVGAGEWDLADDLRKFRDGIPPWDGYRTLARSVRPNVASITANLFLWVAALKPYKEVVRFEWNAELDEYREYDRK